MNKDLMDKLSSHSPSPNLHKAQSKINKFEDSANKKVRYVFSSLIRFYRFSLARKFDTNDAHYEFNNFLQSQHVQNQLKLDKLKRELHQAKMAEVTYTPDLSKTKSFNKRISRSMVSIRRQQSVRNHNEKNDLNRLLKIQQIQNEQDGCTFKPVINKSSRSLKRNLSNLYTATGKYSNNLYYL